MSLFGKPPRLTTCECERSTGATLGQVLLLSNSDEIENKIADGGGRVAGHRERDRGAGEHSDPQLADRERRPADRHPAHERQQRGVGQQGDSSGHGLPLAMQGIHQDAPRNLSN